MTPAQRRQIARRACERCHQARGNVGPWDGEGGYHWRCGPCKLAVWDTPEHWAQLKRDVTRAWRAMLGVKP